MIQEIYEGDCLELIPKLEDRSVNLVCTSPPYAMQRAKLYGGISEADYPAFTVAWMEAFKPKLKENGSILVNIRTSLKNGWLSPYVLKTRLALLEAGWGECEELIWLKRDAPPIGSRYRPRRSWEHILWFSQSRQPYCQPKACGEASSRIGMVGGKNQFDLFGMSAARSGVARIRDVIEVPVAANAKGNPHPAAFPQKLTDVLVRTFSPEGGLVVDPFGGSGTVGLSCIDAGRGFVLMERKPEYAEIIRSRIGAKTAVGPCSFKLASYDKKTEEPVAEEVIQATPETVREAFGLGRFEYPGDCLEVADDQANWLKSMGFSLDRSRFDYAVEIVGEKA